MADETRLDPGIFTPVREDYAVTTLERVFGPLVRAIADGSGIENIGSSDTMLGQLITLLNLAILFFAGAVLIYMIYTSIMDTASDGKMMGQSTDSRYTVLRAAVGVVLLLPVKGGFTIAQVVVLYLLVWGSGLADNAWIRVAENNIASVSYTAPSSRIGSGAHSLPPAATTGFAEAFRARTAGYLCANYLNQASETLGLGTSVHPISANRITVIQDSTGNSNQYRWYFKDNSDHYGNSSSLCGVVRIIAYEYLDPSQMSNIWSNLTGANLVNFTNTFNVLTKDASVTAQVTAMGVIDSYARRLSQQIIQNQRDDEKNKELITEGMSEALDTYITTYQNMMRSYSQTNDYSQALLQMATRNGWIFAANWQRMISNIYVKAKAALYNVTIGASDPSDPQTVFGVGYNGAGSETVVFFQEFRNQRQYFDGISSAFSAAALNRDVMTVGQREFENGTAIMNWLADTVTGLMGRNDGANDASNFWSDPLLEIQDIGTVLLTSAAGAKAVTTASAISPDPRIRAVDQFLGPLATVMVVLGVVLAIIVPFMPIIYYVGAVIGWVILAVEAVFATPITIIMFFAPQRQANFFGSNHNALLTLFGVLLRPFFIVVGLIAAYLIMRVGIDIINVLFTGIVSLLAPEGSISSIYMFLGTIMVYVLVVIFTVMHCCSLITGLSDYVLGWIGVGMSSLVKANPMEGVQGTLGVGGRLPALRGVPELGGRLSSTRKEMLERRTDQATRGNDDRSRRLN